MRISILIPCYNEEKSVRKSAESWLSQTRPADQILIVDDCSKDKTADILYEIIRERNLQNFVVVQPAEEHGQ